MDHCGASARQKVKDRKSNASNGPFEEGRLAICITVYLRDQKQKREKSAPGALYYVTVATQKKAKILHKEAMILIRQSKNFFNYFEDEDLSQNSSIFCSRRYKLFSYRNGSILVI